VRALQHDILQLLVTDGVIARREHPKLASTIDWLVRNGSLRAVLPGVYAQPEICDLLPTRMQALIHWDPDAILVGAAAALVSFWPEMRISCISCSLRHQRRPQPGYEFTRRHIHPSLWSADPACATPRQH
jgi:hypothetical protein